MRNICTSGSTRGEADELRHAVILANNLWFRAQ
jgi:hypothetical protein